MPPNLASILAIFYSAYLTLSIVDGKTSFINVHLEDGKLVADHKANKDRNFQRHYSVKESYNPAEEPSGVVEVANGDSEPFTPVTNKTRVTQYARTFTNSESLSGLFEDDDQSKNIFIYKQIIGQSKKFMFSLNKSGPENYERPKDFDDGDFQMFKVSITDSTVDKALTQLALCEFDGSYQIRKHGNCGKKWILKESFYINNTPTIGTQLIYIGSRDTKPWDSRASTKPLDGTPFTRNQFTMYAEIEENVDVQESTESVSDYSKLYHYVGWTTRYSATNLTLHYYSTESNPPEGFTSAEFGARSVPGFNFFTDQKQHTGLEVFYICEKKEKKTSKDHGAGITITSKRALYDTPCSKSYDEVGTFNSWNKQSDATNDAVEIFVTRRRAWPFDTLLSFTHLSKSDMFKPAFSFWAIPLKVESETFMRSSGLVISGIRSDRMTIEWRKDPFIKMYKVQVTPQPAKMTQFETKENRLRLKGLAANTEYSIEITPTTSGGISLEPMNALQTTAPAAPQIKFPLVRSTTIEIDIGHIIGAEDYRLKIEPEVEEIPSQSSHLTVKAESDTEYTVSLVVVISKAKDIQTTEVQRIIKTSPGPDKLHIDMQVDSDGQGIDVVFKGLEHEAKGYRFKVDAPDDFPTVRRDQFLLSNKVKLDDSVGRNRESITMRVAATLSGSGDEKRETDFVSITTPFKRCHWVNPEKKLTCSGKEGVQSQMLSWTINKDNMVEVRTADNERTTIKKTEVETLNIDNNLLDGMEFKRFVSQFPNLQKLNASYNAIDELEEDTFSRNPKLWKLVLSNNFIKEFPVNLFRYTQGLQILDVSFNPLEYCGLGLAHLQTLETKLRKLDIRETKFPDHLVGHWNALMLYYDVGNAPDFIHQAIYPQLCPKKPAPEPEEERKNGKQKKNQKGKN